MTRRPKLAPDRHKGISVLVRAETEAQVNRWHAAAARDRRPLSQWIRNALDDAAAKWRDGQK